MRVVVKGGIVWLGGGGFAPLGAVVVAVGVGVVRGVVSFAGVIVLIAVVFA